MMGLEIQLFYAKKKKEIDYIYTSSAKMRGVIFVLLIYRQIK